MQMFRLEVVGLLGLDIDDANHPIFCHQRNGQFRANLGIRIDVIGKRADIVDQHGFAPFGDLSDDALAHANAQALGLRRVADLKSHAQLVGAIVQQQDGENSVVNDGANKIRDAMQKRLQVKRGVQRIRKAGEEVDLERIDPRLIARRRSGRNGTVIAFENMMFGGIAQHGLVSLRSHSIARFCGALAGRENGGWLGRGCIRSVGRLTSGRAFLPVGYDRSVCGFIFVGTHVALSG